MTSGPSANAEMKLAGQRWNGDLANGGMLHCDDALVEGREVRRQMLSDKLQSLKIKGPEGTMMIHYTGLAKTESES